MGHFIAGSFALKIVCKEYTPLQSDNFCTSTRETLEARRIYDTTLKYQGGGFRALDVACRKASAFEVS